MNILFSLPVWGATFAQRWLDRGFHSMMLPRNIPALIAQGHHITFHIFTDEAGADILRVPMAQFSGKFLPMPVTMHVGTRVKEAHQISLEHAYRHDQVFCPLVADIVYSSNFWRIVINEIAFNGARGVVTPFVTIDEKYIELLKSRLVSPANMVDLSLETSGVLKGDDTWKSRPYPPHQISLTWHTGNAIMRNYLHLHMHACYPTRKPDTMKWSVDNDLGVVALDDPGQVHVLTDSRQLVYADVVIGGQSTDLDQEGREQNAPSRDPLDIYREWGREWGHDFALDLLRHDFWYGNPTNDARRHREISSDNVVEQIIETIREVMP